MSRMQKEPSPWFLAAEVDWELIHEQVSGFDSGFNSLWVYFQGNFKTAKFRIQFDRYNLLIL